MTPPDPLPRNEEEDEGVTLHVGPQTARRFTDKGIGFLLTYLPHLLALAAGFLGYHFTFGQGHISTQASAMPVPQLQAPDQRQITELKGRVTAIEQKVDQKFNATDQTLARMDGKLDGILAMEKERGK